MTCLSVNLSDFFSESSFRFNDNNYGQRQRKNQKLVLGDRNFLTLEAQLTEEQKANYVVNLVTLRLELLACLSKKPQKFDKIILAKLGFLNNVEVMSEESHGFSPVS